MWAQTFIYYLLLQSKDKGNEDDCPVTGRKQMNQTDLTELFTYRNLELIQHTATQQTILVDFWSTELEYGHSCLISVFKERQT